MELQWDPEQQEAIKLACDIDRRIVGVSGQAGTGKTSLMRAVYHALVEAGYAVVLCAPTGKAAKRIQEATGIQAVTIHRLLEYPHPGERDQKTGKTLKTTEPKRDRFNPLEFDVVLADEYRMVNHEVHRNLIDALPRGGCIRAFGDVNQLPPIESNKQLRDKPSPFEQILTQFTGVILKTIHRQDEGSGIVSNGGLILNGRAPRRLADFTIKVTEKPIDALTDYILEMAEEHNIDFSKTENQIISPSKLRWVGTAALNKMLQNIFRPEKDGWIHLERHSWDAQKTKQKQLPVRVGDKVIWTQNNYDLEIFNGETGIITDTCQDTGDLTIDWGDRVSAVPSVATVYSKRAQDFVAVDPRKDLDLAYAITTHKAQGSEYNHVVYIMARAIMFMLCRPNFYTGVTRARKRVHLITDQRSLSMAISRKTALAG